METATLDYKNAKGWLLPEERELLYQLASELPFRSSIHILNIGVEYGASVVCLRAGNPEALIFASDIEWSKYELPTFLPMVKYGDSHELLNQWTEFDDRHAALNLIFVDGDHGYDGVLLDAKFADYLVNGGYILFQDCYDHVEIGKVHALVPGVNAAVSDWFSQHSKEFEELPYVGSTRVFKRIANAA